MVIYSSEHNGHDKDLKHFTLSQLERQRIAGMISAGIEFNEILNTVRDNLSLTETTRLHLLKRRDIRNIANEFHLGKVRNKEDGRKAGGRGRRAPNDKMKHLKEIEELMNTIRGSLVGDPNQDVIATAREVLKAAAAQITAVSFRPAVQPGTSSTNINEPFSRKEDKEVRSKVGNSINSKSNRQSRKKGSVSERLTITGALALEGEELVVTHMEAEEVHGYVMDDHQQFERSYISRKSE